MRTNRSRVACLAAFMLLSSCLVDDRKAKRGSVVDNEVRSGLIFLANGKPAVDARVRLYPVNHLPDSLALPKGGAVAKAAGNLPAAEVALFSTRTDPKGRYFVDSLPAGEYNVLGELAGGYSYQDSIYISDRLDSIPADTLRDPGSAKGIVAMQPNHDTRTVTVQVLGTNTYANVDAEGRFTLGKLARGDYALRILTSEKEYTPLFMNLRIRSGEEGNLRDTIRLTYTGIPVVTGIKATYDTLGGIVHLAWDPVAYRDYSDYLVFRDPSPAAALSGIPVGLAKDAHYSDSLPNSVWADADSPAGQAVRLEYRVRVRNNSDQVGLSYKKLIVDAPPPSRVSTRIRLQLRRVVWDSVRQADSVDFVAILENPSRTLKRISWFIGDTSATAAVHTLNGTRTDEDSLHFGWAREGTYRVYVMVEDDAGSKWPASLKVAGNSAPYFTSSLGVADTTIRTNKPFLMSPTASDPDGDAIRFSAKGLPAWLGIDSVTGRISGTPLNGQAGSYPGIEVSIADARRRKSLPAITLTVESYPWATTQPLPGSRPHVGATAVVGNKLYFLDNSADEIFSYGFTEGSWSPIKAESYAKPIRGDGYTVDGRIYYFSYVDNYRLVSYDPASGSFMTLAAPPDSKPRFTGGGPMAVADGKIFSFGTATDGKGLSVHAYDPALDSWTVKNPGPYSLTGSAAATLAGKIYLFGGSQAYRDKVGIYDPATDTWSSGTPMPRTLASLAACALNGKIYVLGESGANPTTTLMAVYDPAQGTWAMATDMPGRRNGTSCHEHGGKLYVGGGTSAESATGALNVYDPEGER